MAYLDNCMVCVLDTETTGLKAGTHDIIQICAIPLTIDFQAANLQHFQLDLKPRYPQNIEWDALNCNKRTLENILERGFDPWNAADLFFQWFESLNCKRLMPLAHNWPFDRDFIKDWLGPETFNLIFDSRYRDLMSAINFVNDSRFYKGEQVLMHRHTLKYICGILQIEWDHMGAHDAIFDCLKTVEAYRTIVRNNLYV